jgi:hypothetical protein
MLGKRSFFSMFRSFYDETIHFFEMFWKMMGWQVFLTFVITLVLSLLLNERSVVLSFGLAIFAAMSQTTLLLRRKHEVRFTLFVMPLSQMNSLQTGLFLWTYISVLCLVTGTLGKIYHIQTVFGVCRVFYLAVLILSLLLFIRMWGLLFYYGPEVAMKDFVFFFLVTCIPMFVLETSFGGFQFFGVPKDLVTARITGSRFPWERMAESMAMGAAGARVGTVAKKARDLMTGEEAKIQNLENRVEEIDKKCRELNLEIRKDFEELKKGGSSFDTQSDRLKQMATSGVSESSPQKVLEATKGPVDYGFAVKGLPQSAKSPEVAAPSADRPQASALLPSPAVLPEEHGQGEDIVPDTSEDETLETTPEVSSESEEETKSVVSTVVTQVVEQVPRFIDEAGSS